MTPDPRSPVVNVEAHAEQIAAAVLALPIDPLAPGDVVARLKRVVAWHLTHPWPRPLHPEAAHVGR